ncbi:hypothetical protein IQ250_12790 [Pseudanabaenaceae cyanobacterium LEGE 13415]|nr:hypothetical protein [Pseudanabaenaceae cyanobacterium LEGE 13415]
MFRDISFIQDSLNVLSQTAIDPQTLIANSCIVRDRVSGSFFVTGAGGLPIRPGDPAPSPYPTGEIQSPQNPIMEPQGIYKLPNGQYLMSRECR